MKLEPTPENIRGRNLTKKIEAKQNAEGAELPDRLFAAAPSAPRAPTQGGRSRLPADCGHR